MTTELPQGPTSAQVARMERAVVQDIEMERMRRRVRRGRVWTGAAATVAVVALAALVSPAVVSGTSGGAQVSSAAAPMSDQTTRDMAEPLSGSAELATPDESLTSGSVEGATTGGFSAGREVAASGWLSVTVSDPTDAQRRITELAAAAGGYVQSVSSSGAPIELMIDPSLPAPAQSSITVRVPADRLDELVASAGELGAVTSSSIDRVDVTDQAVDLRARVAAQETSVARLTELMAQATSVADLISAESALAERQAALDSDRQQLAMLEDQVALSTLTISLVEDAAPVAADPAGFGDGIAAGWNGLVATLNGIVIGLGFLLPWIGILAVLVVVIWVVRRLVRARRVRPATDQTPTPPGSDS